MPDGLYERDILAWADRQAGLMRRLANGERLNEAIDWPNVIEELEAVGRSELRACASLLRQAMMHLIKLHLEPGSLAAPHWRGEVTGFLADARDAFSPSMRQQLDMPKLFADAWRRVQAESGGVSLARAKQGECPFTVDDLLFETADLAALVARLS